MSSFSDINGLIGQQGFIQQFFSDFRHEVNKLHGNSEIATDAIRDPEIFPIMAQWAIQRIKNQGSTRLLTEENSKYMIISDSEVDRTLSFSSFCSPSENFLFKFESVDGMVYFNLNRSDDNHWFDPDVVSGKLIFSPLVIKRYIRNIEKTWAQSFFSLSSNLDDLTLSESVIIALAKKYYRKLSPKIPENDLLAEKIAFLCKYEDRYQVILFSRNTARSNFFTVWKEDINKIPRGFGNEYLWAPENKVRE